MIALFCPTIWNVVVLATCSAFVLLIEALR
jgi:hypothetical protein